MALKFNIFKMESIITPVIFNMVLMFTLIFFKKEEKKKTPYQVGDSGISDFTGELEEVNCQVLWF